MTVNYWTLYYFETLEGKKNHKLYKSDKIRGYIRRRMQLSFSSALPLLPLRAMTLLAGFIMALSAEIGLRIGLFGSFMSIITTCACSPTFSRMQMNLSDSMVKVLNPMLAGFMPRFWSCKENNKYCKITKWKSPNLQSWQVSGKLLPKTCHKQQHNHWNPAHRNRCCCEAPRNPEGYTKSLVS